MARFLKWTRPRGAVHNVQDALNKRDIGCNVLLLSDASLYALQNFVALDLTFASRWADEALEFGYHPIAPGAENYGAWVDLVHQIQGEVVDVSCDIVGVLEDLTDKVNAGNVILTDIKTALVAIQTSLDAQTTALDPDDTLIDDIEPILDAINIILGGAAVLVP